MAKEFAPRVSKKDRKTVDLSHMVNRDIYKALEEQKGFLKGAELEVLDLKDIVVKEQVRTRFDDVSLKELAENIKVNGLIQPLVVHRERGKYVLICGERRYRAMKLIKVDEAPCFIMSGKTQDELMAIQFSENSSREQLHYIDKADGVYDYQRETGASERKIVAALAISKTEVHRSLLIAKLPEKLKQAAKIHDTEKYVLIELDSIAPSKLKTMLEEAVISGEITKRSQLAKAIKDGGLTASKVKNQAGSEKRKAVSASVFIKAMQSKIASKSGAKEFDKETIKMLKSLVEETRDLVDL